MASGEANGALILSSGLIIPLSALANGFSLAMNIPVTAE